MDDVLASASYDWSGSYNGVYGGGLWSKSDVTDLGVLVEKDVGTDGLTGGSLAGFNYQNGQLILGLDRDFGWSNANGKGCPIAGCGVSPNTYDLNWDDHSPDAYHYKLGHPYKAAQKLCARLC